MTAEKEIEQPAEGEIDQPAERPGVVWWRRFVRAMYPFALVLAALAALQLVLAALSPARVDHLGHGYSAARLTGTHLLGILPLVVMACAWFAARGQPAMRRRSLVVVAAAGLALLLCELGLNLSHARRDYNDEFPRLGWWTGEEPQGRMRTKATPGRSYPFHYHINPQGFRALSPTPLSFARARVVCLGDSFTWGDWVREEHSWPAQAEKRSGLSFVNAGVQAYGVDQMATLYEDRIVSRYDHTAVIVAVIAEDAQRATQRFNQTFRKPFTSTDGELDPAPSPLRVFGLTFAPESQLLRPWRESASQALRAAGVLPDRLEHFSHAMRRIRAAAGSGRQVSLIVLSSKGSGTRYFSELSQRAKAAGFADTQQVDLSGLYLPDGHPTPAGHARIAAAACALVTPTRTE